METGMSEPRVVVITGGASGMGRGTGHRFAKSGDRIVVADVNSNLGHMVVREIEDNGGQAIFHDLDVSEENSVNTLFAWVETEVGPIDVLVNSAGVLQNPMPITEMSMEEHDRMWDINNRGLYMCCRAVAPFMKGRGRGNIINIASTTSFVAWPLTAYDPGKTSVKMLSEVLAAEMGPKGIRVNAVAPHITATPAIQTRIDAGERDPTKIVAQNALPKMVEVEDVAEAIFFLCSPEAKSITGVTLPVDCGFLVASSYNSYPK
jgi:NAD(P)-dependent dehydrogenase (short-subunit alcohol dehydrogenase family)